MLKKTILSICVLGLISCSTFDNKNMFSGEATKSKTTLKGSGQSGSSPSNEDQSSAEHFYKIGSMYDVGGDKDVDLHKAKINYVKAVKEGSIDALNALGVLEINKKNYVGAAKYFNQAAEKGDEIAYFNLGNLALIDKTQNQANNTLAIEMYGKAASKKYSPAMVALGDMYSTGRGVDPDFKKAENHYKQAADLGDTEGMNRLALLYLLQDGVDIDENTENAKKTFELIQQAAKKGDPQALYVLSMAYQNGFMVQTDSEKALVYLKQSADLGWAEAQYSLAYLYLTGFELEQDTQKAIEYFTKSADGGYSNAQNNLGMLYLKGEVIPKDLKKAEVYLKNAAFQGNPMSAHNLSLAYSKKILSGGSEKEIKQLIEHSVESGYTPAMITLAEYYSQGIMGFEKNNEKSRELIDRAISEDDNNAMMVLANAYFSGSYGYAKDMKKAKEWLDKAKAAGNPSASKTEQIWRNIQRADVAKLKSGNKSR